MRKSSPPPPEWMLQITDTLTSLQSSLQHYGANVASERSLTELGLWQQRLTDLVTDLRPLDPQQNYQAPQHRTYDYTNQTASDELHHLIYLCQNYITILPSQDLHTALVHLNTLERALAKTIVKCRNGFASSGSMN